MTNCLSIQDLTYTYKRSKPALAGVTVVATGSSIAILGPNGAGKSTLLRILTGAQRGQYGTITWNDQVIVTARNSQQYFKSRLGVMPQSLQIFNGYTCEEFLRYVSWLRKVPNARAEVLIGEVLQSFDLGDHRKTRVKALSGGMRQRLGLAQAVVNEPEIIVLDEPTAGLDPAQRMAFRSSLVSLSRRATVILATHLVEDVAASCDYVVLLDRGVVRFGGTTSQFCAEVGENEVSGSAIEKAYLSLVVPRV